MTQVNDLDKILFGDQHPNNRQIYRLRFDPLERKELDIHQAIYLKTKKHFIAPKHVVLDAAAKTFGIDKEDILGKSRKREIVYARYFCMIYAACNQHPDHKLSHEKISKMYGDKDHVMVGHALKINQRLSDSKDKIWLESRDIFVRHILNASGNFEVEMFPEKRYE